MTTQPQSQCGACTHFRSPFDFPRNQRPAGPACAAFPAGIPDAVYEMVLDHRQPVDGDHGVRWQSNGQPYPEYALATGQP